MSLTILKNQQSIWVSNIVCMQARICEVDQDLSYLNDLSSILILFNVEILQVMIV